MNEDIFVTNHANKHSVSKQAFRLFNEKKNNKEPS